MPDLTVANSSFSLSVTSVFAVPIPMQEYSADDAFSTENVVPNETLMGVDGNLSGGYVPYPVKLKFVLQADSLSIIFMDQWRQAMDQAQTTYTANATIIIPALVKIFTFTKGFLTGAMPMPGAKKIAQPQTYEITFNKMTAAGL